jgi:hypothetical protein
MKLEDTELRVRLERLSEDTDRIERELSRLKSHAVSVMLDSRIAIKNSAVLENFSKAITALDEFRNKIARL